MRFRFSLRLFLILFTLLAIAFGAAANFYFGIKRELKRHDAACERLYQFKVYVMDQPALESPEHMSLVKLLSRRWIDERAFPVTEGLYLPPLRDTKESELILEAAQGLAGLHRLTLHVDHLSLKCVTLLAQLRDLTSLHLLVDSIAPEAIGPFARLRSVEYLTINSPVDQEAIGAIVRLPHLKYLTLDVTKLSPEAISALQHFPSLRQVTIMGKVESPEIISACAENPTLFRLSLADCKVTLESLRGLANAKSIAILNIWQECDAPVDIFEAVAKAPNLRIVTLSRNAVSSKLDLSPLTQSTSIEEIHIANFRLSSEKVQSLLSIPQIDKLSFADSRSEDELIRFLQEQVKLRLAFHHLSGASVFEWNAGYFRLDGGVLSRVDFAGERP